MTDNQDLRDEALESLKRKKGFRQYVVVYVLVNAGLIIAWAMSDPRPGFWPGWPLFGMSIALVVTGWNAYGSGSRPITDKQVDEEIRRLKGE